ncbi:MAG: glycosyltransferase family 39 protein [Flavobacteriales bacterium]|nr:glycosyltransferase family 39 protein [Flavobacteriales bacterium]
MEYWHSILYILALLVVLFAFVNGHSKKDIWVLNFIILASFILRITIASDPFLHEWDERFHALVAKNLINHPLTPTLYDYAPLGFDAQSWVGSHVWLHKQPLPLWLMSISLYVLGINELALRFPSIVIGVLSVWLTFQIGRKLFNRHVSLIAAFLHSIHGLTLELIAGRVATDHIDIAFAFFIELAIYIVVCHRKTWWNYLLIGISVGLAILCKWLPAYIVLGIYGAYNLNSIRTFEYWKGLFVIVCASVLVFLPWQIYIFSEFPQEAAYEAQFNYRHFSEVLEGQTGSWYYFIHKIGTLYGELIYVPVVWLIWRGLRKFNIKLSIIALWIIVPVVFFSIPLTKMQGYILFTAPAFFILTGLFIQLMKYRFYQKKIIYNLMVLLLIGLPVRYSIERFKPFEKIETPDWRREIDIIKQSNQGKKHLVVFNFHRPIECMFYTDFYAYHRMPTDKDIRILKKENIEFIIWNDLH